jgi:hypothetical protein
VFRCQINWRNTSTGLLQRIFKDGESAMATVRKLVVSLSLLASVLLGVSASAHHSTASYDRNNKVLIEGTIKKFKWTNPHSWIFVEVPDDKGGSEEWALECGSIAQLKNIGWTRELVNEGSKVKIIAIIARDGSKRGEVQTLFNQDGKQFKNAIGY